MHNELHILVCCIALWCVLNGGETARNAVNPEILANFAKNVATVLSPAVLGDLQSRRNRSSLQPILTIPLRLNDDDPDTPSAQDNIVDNTSNAAAYHQPDSYPYNRLYASSVEEFKGSEANERLKESLRDESYLRQEPLNYYKPYGFSASGDNLEAIRKSTDNANIESSIGNIEGSPTNLYSSYHGPGFHKTALGHETFPLTKTLAGFPGFGPYGYPHHYHHHHHHHPYGSDESSEEAAAENARQENNGTNHRGYGPPFGDPYGHPFPYGGYGGYGHHDPFYGPHRNGNDSGNGRDGHHGYGPYHGGPDFYGPPGYGYGNHGYNNNRNGNGNNNNNNRQTEEPADNGDQNNSTKNGYPGPYGPPLVKPFLGFHGFPSPFLPYNHFHGIFKGGPVGVGHVGYPLYADPYLIGFPFHHPYGPFFHGKKYLPPKGRPADSGESGESTEAPAGELTENENPERITLNDEEVAPASSSNRYKSSGQKGLKVSLINFKRKV